MITWIENPNDDTARYQAAERFVAWLERRVMIEARGDEEVSSHVDPTGRFWLGRLGPKDFVTRPDERQDRLEPCAIGVRIRPAAKFPLSFEVRVGSHLWKRRRADDGGGLRWAWDKTDPVLVSVPIVVEDKHGDQIFGSEPITEALVATGAEGLSGEIRVRMTGRTPSSRALEITFVNTSQEITDFADGRFFEAYLEVIGLARRPFELETLPDSFRYDRHVQAYGINCGFTIFEEGTIRTSDGPAHTKERPTFWPSTDQKPDLTFARLAADPIESARRLLRSFEEWSASVWSDAALEACASAEQWSDGMRQEAQEAQDEFRLELERIRSGVRSLETNERLRTSFQLMNRAMRISAAGKYDEWRPFQLAFLLANLRCLVDPIAEAEIVDIVWFATGGGKTETYLGLLLTAAFLDRKRGKISGITAWSRFPLRLLSLQQTQRFANALAAAEMVRREVDLPGDPFSLGFLVGGGATPNRIVKDGSRRGIDAETVEEKQNPFMLLDRCPFCRERTVGTEFDRLLWRLDHICSNADCPTAGAPLPIHVIDDEIWRFLPTIVIGTLDKAANISRQTGMRGLVGSPHGKCKVPGHGYTYATRSMFPNGCFVPDCPGGAPGPLPMAAELYPVSFRLQDELHLLRDSLGAVDAHYECALDGIQEQLTGSKPKILASSATLSGYAKQVDVLYRRKARVFPQPPPIDGQGFWAADSGQVMRRYVAFAPRRLTVEFVVDRLIVTLQRAIRRMVSNPQQMCNELAIDAGFAQFLIDLYGTNVIYGNTLQDIDAVLRSSETQYAELEPPPNVATLTGRVGFEEVKRTLDRLEAAEQKYEDRLHLVAASSMMSHGVDIDRLNVMIMLAFPLGVAEFIQATARVGRKWPALVIVVPKMTRERDASVYRAFPEFVSHGDRFVEPIPITRKSRRVLERTISGLELARINLIHEPASNGRMTMIRDLNQYLQANPDMLVDDERSIAVDIGIDEHDEFMRAQLQGWFEGFARNLREPPADARFPSDASPTGSPMTSLRDVEEQAPLKGNSTS
ncbi:helicase [Acetobacter estunensis NRIC 0472]|uniref:DNA helicase n=1 Tax=Acetobacter estunensis TaxID=104097 RepID=A0A967EDE1_9PROT|nr:helicase-related protein [Acetobacter estunensis]NHO53905.1 DNA helicase [Acetobacter estunensis]GBQ26947.1 helicase [Acetobacter estunensis NRIC 0472]